MFNIGKMKVDNVVVLFCIHSFGSFCPMPCANFSLTCIGKCNFNMWVYHTKCIKRVGGFPNKVMVLVATLGIDVALT